MLEARHLAVERGDLLRIGDLGHDDDVGTPAHDGSQIGVPFGLQGIDTDGGDDTGGPPTGIKLAGQRPGLRPQRGRREVLKFLDQHVGSGGAGGGESRRLGARQKQPAAPQRGRAAPHGRGRQGRRHGNRLECACIFRQRPSAWLRPI